MHNLLIKEGKYTPFISLNNDTGTLKIKGESSMAHVFDFYSPIIQKIENLLKLDRSKSIQLYFHLLYFNTGSSGIFSDIFRFLEDQANPVIVHWLVEPNDIDTLYEGESYQEDFPKLKFNIKEQAYDPDNL